MGAVIGLIFVLAASIGLLTYFHFEDQRNSKLEHIG